LRGQFRAKRDAPIDQVVADLNQARTIDPDFWLLYDVLGRVYFFAGRYEEAAEAFRREAEIKPHGGQARWWRAMSLRGARRLEEAKVEVAAAVDVDAGYVLRNKGKELRARGYLPSTDPRKLTREALHDAVHACMIDPQCW
jgi:tetratricopeptide (TPR) repeat protein